MRDYKEIIKDFVFKEKASLFGVCDFRKVDKSNFLLEKEVLDRYPYAISIGRRLSKAVLESIKDHPTQLYFHHYRQINNFLDNLALRITFLIEEFGYSALPIPASQIVDWQNQKAHLSHKKIAYYAGLGWIGRNNLLVNERYGSQIRLVTILTDIPLTPDKENPNLDCGDCYACINICPAGAIKEKKEDFDHLKCFEKLKEFQKKGYVGQYICGLCVKVCKGKEL
ncbi:MAG: hypothetical protein ABIK40_06980 [candidate division WOR-3 bacterium]